MAYSYRSKRSVKRLARRSRRNFIITLILIVALGYITLQWILPTFITGIGFIKEKVKPSLKTGPAISENVSLAPPVLNIPYEATNTAQINLSGYGTPGSKVKLFIDDNEVETVDVSSDGSFTFRNVTLSFGTNNIYGKSIDENQKESLPSKTVKVIYDNEKPNLQVLEPEDGKTIQGGDKKVKIAGTTEPQAQILINGSQVVVDKDGKFESSLSLNDGENNFTIKAVDSAGNSTEISRRVVYQP